MMVTDEQIVEHITHALRRPLMWASTPEALEGMIFAFYWVLHGRDLHSDFAKWAADKHDVRRNSPLWAQKDFTVSDYAVELTAFLKSEGVI